MTTRSMVAREGRENQCYSPITGARVVAGTVVLNEDKTKILVVTSAARPDRYVLPKGGVEKDEADPSESAIRETWEEAGVTGKITKSLGVIEDMRPAKTWKENSNGTWPPRSEFHFFEMQFETAEDKWPESSTRTRKWLSYEEAKQEMLKHNRYELAEAIDRSSVVRS